MRVSGRAICARPAPLALHAAAGPALFFWDSLLTSPTLRSRPIGCGQRPLISIRRGPPTPAASHRRAWRGRGRAGLAVTGRGVCTNERRGEGLPSRPRVLGMWEGGERAGASLIHGSSNPLGPGARELGGCLTLPEGFDP